MNRILLTATSILLITPAVLPLSAAAQSADTCRDRIHFELAREQRLFRAMLYGKPGAGEAPLNTVRYDNEGIAWLKEDTNRWINADEEQQGLVWSDATMNQRDEHADFLPIKGIFETRRVTTSELIPYLLQSVQALECRADAVCLQATRSLGKQGDQPSDLDPIQPTGCREYDGRQSFPQCHAGEGGNEELIQSAGTPGYCRQIAKQLIERERQLLRLAVEYDAGYRSLLQFAGNMDIFLRELRWPLTGTIRQAVRLLGQLDRIPCFVASCDAAPPASGN